MRTQSARQQKKRGEIMMARIWHGKTKASQAGAYRDFLIARAIPDYQSITGNLGVHILRRIEGDEAHFIMLTFWENAEAIKAFAGEDFEKARYYPEDKEFLLEFEPKVTHYEVLVALEAGIAQEASSRLA
jgi:heme-degrading monooxygenase HmoA